MVNLSDASTCAHGKPLLEFPDLLQREFSFVKVDELVGSVGQKMVQEGKEPSEYGTLPTPVVVEQVVGGCREAEPGETLQI